MSRLRQSATECNSLARPPLAAFSIGSVHRDNYAPRDEANFASHEREIIPSRIDNERIDWAREARALHLQLARADTHALRARKGSQFVRKDSFVGRVIIATLCAGRYREIQTAARSLFRIRLVVSEAIPPDPRKILLIRKRRPY
jgi:hypothetical protein